MRNYGMNAVVKVSRRRFMGALGACAASAYPLLAGSRPESTGIIVIENAHIRYTISGEGRNMGLIDKNSGRQYLHATRPSAFVSLRKGGRILLPSSCHRDGERIVSSFNDLHAQVVCAIQDRGDFFKIDVESVRGDGIEELNLLNLRVMGLPNLGRIANLAWNDQFGVAVMALNLQTKAGCGVICDTYLGADMQPAPPLIMSPSWWDRGQECNMPVRDASGAITSPQEAVLSASCFPKFSMERASVALLGCASSQLRYKLKRLVKEVGFIQSDVGGAWALDAPQNRTSYLFCLASEHDIDGWIDLAKAGGFQTLVLDKIGPHGQYIPDPNKFPKGIDGVKEVVRKIRAAGLVPAWHTLSFAIDKNDPWVSPTPHPDLAVRSTVTLARNISADDTFIPLVQSPAHLPARAGFWFRGGMDIAVEGEILTYRGLQTSSPYGLTECIRGAHGTRASAHKAGAPLKNLQEVFERFAPAPNSRLMEAMQARMAEIIRTCEFEMFYLDGLDGSDIFEGPDWSWYHGPQFATGVFRHVGRPVGMEASGWYHHNWHITSRIGAWDGTDRDHKRFIDLHIKNNRQICDLLPTQLGWWKLVRDQGRQGYATPPGAVEYLCAKGLGYGEPFSLNGVTPAEVKSSPLWSESMEIMGRYERLRQSGKVTETLKEKLRVLGEEYRLTENSMGESQFVPIDYAEHKWVGGDGSSAPWLVRNRFHAQQPGLRIRALTSVEPYNSPHAPIIADFSKGGEFPVQNATRGVTVSLETSASQVKAGKASGLFQAENHLARRRGAWAMVGKEFDPPIDLSLHPALGVWVMGDGKGEVLNFQVLDANGPNAAVEDHYVIVDFDGWRYFELVEPESARWNEFQWPYYEWFAVYGEPVDLAHTSRLNLYYNNLQPGLRSTCRVSPLKALGLRASTLKDLRLEIGGRSIEFPVELKSGNYLECDSNGHGKVFDPNGGLLDEFQARGLMPTLNTQDNNVGLTCQATPGLNPRVQVTVISTGTAIPI